MFYYKIRQHNNTHSPLTAIKQTLTTLNHRRLCLVSKILKRTDIFTGELVEHYVIIRRSYRCDKQSTITRLRNGLMFTKLHSRQSCTPIPNNCSLFISYLCREILSFSEHYHINSMWFWCPYSKIHHTVFIKLVNNGEMFKEDKALGLRSEFSFIFNVFNNKSLQS